MTYAEYYDNNIRKKLEDIDIFIRSDEPITVTTISALLDITPKEIYSFVKKNSISCLNKVVFFHIMFDGSSEICQLYKRQNKRMNNQNYSIDDICYIYGLNHQQVEEGYITANLDLICDDNIQKLFKHIEL